MTDLEGGRITFGDGSHLLVEVEGVEVVLVELVRDGEIVGKLPATLHFKDLDPEYHQVAMNCVKCVRLILAPRGERAPAWRADGGTGYRSSPPGARKRANDKPWWKLW